MPEAGALRLFFALWPDDEMRARLARETAAAAAESGGRVIPPENLHVTLLFLGRTPREHLSRTIAAAARVRARPVRITFDQVETWARAHVVALTSSTPSLEALELAEALRAELAGLAPEEAREFRPHVTLARDARRRAASQAIAPIEWRAREFVLVESNMTRTGSLYAVRERWPLAA